MSVGSDCQAHLCPHFLSTSSPQRSFTAKPGVAALRRTPGKKTEISPNPNGVPQRPMPPRKTCICDVEPRWGSWGFVGAFLGCAVVTATPGFVV
jgi:hypothetical protein